MGDRKGVGRRQAPTHDALFRVLFDASPAGLLLFDIQLQVTDCNEALLQFLHVTRDTP